jgi:hypothetical protein
MQFDPNTLTGRWRVRFEDGKDGWMQLEPRDAHGHMPGRLFIPNSVIDYPPNSKRVGRDYDHEIRLDVSDPGHMGSGKYSMFHWHGSSGQGMFHWGLVADGVIHAKTLICEDGGKIMQYPGTGYPFQFMGGGEFTATRV